MFQSKKTQLVELPVPATVTTIGQRVNFTDQPQLRTVDGQQTIYIRAIETFIDQVIPFGPFFFNAVATAAQLPLAVLVLNVKGFEDYQYIPLPKLNVSYANPVAAASVPWQNRLFLLKDVCEVDWTKSYVQFVGTPPAAAFSYVFMVHYEPMYYNNGRPGPNPTY